MIAFVKLISPKNEGAPFYQSFREITNPANLGTLEKQFLREYCKIQGLISESGLEVITKASTLALPKMVKMTKIL